ncbi:MAG: hypothetical protein GY927_07505 [bacterium]|nr:hypothetical protein [bacterium]
MTNVDSEANGLMRIAVFVDPAVIWQWHKWLVEALASSGHQVDLCINGRAPVLPVKLRLLLQLEALLYSRGRDNASDLISIEQFDKVAIIAQPASTGYDLVIDLAGETNLSSIRARRFRPLYDGMVGSDELIGVLLDGHAPSLSLDDSDLHEPRWFGLCAIEQPQMITQGLNNVFSRMAEFLRKSVYEITENIVQVSDVPPGTQTDRNRSTIPMKAERFLLGNLGVKVANRLNALLRKEQGNATRWGVGWRFTDSKPLRETNELCLGHYTRLLDDGQCFYADPFVIFHEGLYHVFVEEFPFNTQKGIISHFTIDRKGNTSAPKEVLSRPYHLSYPFIFEHDGQFWMIPETSANNAVELYRAASFPDKWVFEKTLIDDVRADDVTLVRHGDHWWLFAAISEWQSSQWDTLGLFYADDLFGNWYAHQANPVLLDARAARPAGAMYMKDGALWRPAQDCSSIYGGGLSLCRVDQLDPERFEQTIVHRFAPDDKDQLYGFHTLNEHQGLEVVDFFGRL